MNITEQDKIALDRKQIVLYTLIILFCIISILIAFYVQFYARIDIAKKIGIKNEESKYGNKTEDEIETLKLEFENIFNNQIQNDNGNNSKKADKGQNLVYAKYSKQAEKQGDYEININIPNINIDNEIIEKYNKEIENLFATKAVEVLNSEKKNIIYTVDYTACVEEGILSLMIKSNLKQGSSAQRVIVQTYNYDLRNNKKISLEEVLNIEELDKNIIQNQINTEIQKQENKVNDLKQLGYNIFDRDIKSDIYKIENSTEFYLTGDTLYVIYAYGNNSYTSEMDIVVL